MTGLAAEREHDAATRRADHGRLQGLLSTAIAGRPAAHWERAFGAADVPYGRVRRLEELPGTPQNVAREMFTAVDGPTGAVHVRQPLFFDGVAPGPGRGVPGLGEQTAEILGECRPGAAPSDGRS